MVVAFVICLSFAVWALPCSSPLWLHLSFVSLSLGERSCYVAQAVLYLHCVGIVLKWLHLLFLQWLFVVSCAGSVVICSAEWLRLSHIAWGGCACPLRYWFVRCTLCRVCFASRLPAMVDIWCAYSHMGLIALYLFFEFCAASCPLAIVG